MRATCARSAKIPPRNLRECLVKHPRQTSTLHRSRPRIVSGGGGNRLFLFCKFTQKAGYRASLLHLLAGHVRYHTELSGWTDMRLATAISSNAFLIWSNSFLRYVEVPLVHWSPVCQRSAVEPLTLSAYNVLYNVLSHWDSPVRLLAGHVHYHTELSGWTDALAAPGWLATTISSNAVLKYVEVPLVHWSPVCQRSAVEPLTLSA